MSQKQKRTYAQFQLDDAEIKRLTEKYDEIISTTWRSEQLARFVVDRRASKEHAKLAQFRRDLEQLPMAIIQYMLKFNSYRVSKLWQLNRCVGRFKGLSQLFL